MIAKVIKKLKDVRYEACRRQCARLLEENQAIRADLKAERKALSMARDEIMALQDRVEDMMGWNVTPARLRRVA